MQTVPQGRLQVCIEQDPRLLDFIFFSDVSETSAWQACSKQLLRLLTPPEMMVMAVLLAAGDCIHTSCIPW
jgi:hypothetical protein